MDNFYAKIEHARSKFDPYTMDTLPDEIVLWVLKMSGPQLTATRWRLVCRRLYGLSRDEQMWLEFRSPFGQPPPAGHTNEFMYMVENCDKYEFRSVKLSQLEGFTYRGQVNSDREPHGWGMCNYGNTRIVGEFVNGKKHGVAIRQFYDGTLYIGHWCNNKKSGYGEYYWTDGETYRGNWENDEQYGYGEYQWACDDRYNGDWNAGAKSGYGVHVWGSGPWKGDIYEGNWHADKQTGFGTYTWNDGRRYCGNWVNHTRDGFGVYEFNTTTKYAGNWTQGVRSGNGIMFTPTSVISCHWKWDIPDDERLHDDIWNGFFLLDKQTQRKFTADQLRSAAASGAKRPYSD